MQGFQAQLAQQLHRCECQALLAELLQAAAAEAGGRRQIGGAELLIETGFEPVDQGLQRVVTVGGQADALGLERAGAVALQGLDQAGAGGLVAVFELGLLEELQHWLQQGQGLAAVPFGRRPPQARRQREPHQLHRCR